ncbi:HbmRII [Burkholderia pseudomallei]|uniref:HbmRII n=1 Tax=Burkholderia pseudomallei TaxID=28450 RepID=UPI0003031778|nr:HbmRII [Burkholderia pseudomallei]EXI98159.1 HbmRII [Burkholderia pseudomallei MSHR6137]MDY7779313.1 HbmRII [Burkholderia pseudomallei]MDY7810039.1 HbmRII [Burkholderia pseudomallei]
MRIRSAAPGACGMTVGDRRGGADALALRSRATCAWLWRGRIHPQARARSIRALEPAFGVAVAALGRSAARRGCRATWRVRRAPCSRRRACAAARFASCIDDRRQNRVKHGRDAGKARVKHG